MSLLLLTGCWKSTSARDEAGDAATLDDTETTETPAGSDDLIAPFPGPCIREKFVARMIDERCIYSYDATDRLSLIECDGDYRFMDGTVDTVTRYSYDDQGYTEVQKVTDAYNPSVRNTMVTLYDPDGNIVELSNWCDTELRLLEICQNKTLDDFTAMRECSDIAPEDHNGEWTTVFHYNGEGLLITEDRIFQAGLDGDRRTFSYDEKKRLILEEWYFHDPVSGEWKALSDKRIHYTYDLSGNLLEEIHDNGASYLEKTGWAYVTAHYFYNYDCWY